MNPPQPSIRSAGQSFFSLLLCCCSSRGCNMGLLWFPSLLWWFILFSWMTSLMNGTFRSSPYIMRIRPNLSLSMWTCCMICRDMAELEPTAGGNHSAFRQLFPWSRLKQNKHVVSVWRGVTLGLVFRLGRMRKECDVLQGRVDGERGMTASGEQWVAVICGAVIVTHAYSSSGPVVRSTAVPCKATLLHTFNRIFGYCNTTSVPTSLSGSYSSQEKPDVGYRVWRGKFQVASLCLK
jgi:hypothetical protein